ncbi:MAG: AAA family ATPase [Streptosporangiaceae bacterium]
MTVTLERPDLTALADEQLAGMFGGADAALITDLLAELDRRDAEEKAARRRQARRDDSVRCEWESAAHAQMLAAEAACAGNLVRRDSWMTDAWQLWSGPEHVALANATEELRNFWDDNPRITVTEYARALRADLERNADDALDADGPAGLRHQRAAGADGAVPAAGPDGDGRPVRPGGPMSTFADVVPLSQEWVWQDFIPAAELAVVAARGGSGKSFLMCDLAARVSTGRDMPDGSPGGPPASVIMINLEDSAEVGTVHRLMAAGADLTRIHDLSVVDGHPFSVPDDIPALRAAIAEIGDVALVTVDPLSAVSSVSLASVTGTRMVLRSLQAVAHDTGCAVAVIHHATKAGSIAGSAAVVDGVRLALVIEPDKAAGAGTMALRVHKSNISRSGARVRYQLAGEWPQMTVAWQAADDDRQAVALTASDAVILALAAASAPMSPRELTAATGQSYGSIRVACCRLLQAGEIGMAGRGAYVAAGNSNNGVSPQVSGLAAVVTG